MRELQRDHRFSRRGFLKGSIATSLAAGAVSFGGMPSLLSLAHAGEENPGQKNRHFVFCYFSGGWDVLLSLDPRNPIAFNNGNLQLTRIQPAYELLDDDENDGSLKTTASGISYGPYIGDLLGHSAKMAVVRGMSMDTLTHEVGRRRFITGKPPSGLLARGSSAATWFASKLGGDQPIPNLSVRVESYNVDQPNFATGLKVASVPDLVRALKSEEPIQSKKVTAQLDALLAQAAKCEYAKKSATWKKAEESRVKAVQMVSAGYDSLFDFQAKTPAMAALRDHYGIAPTGAAALQSPEAQAAMAATALTAGLSRAVSIQPASGLDTHYDDWASDQGPRQERGFNAIARLIEDLEAKEYPGTGQSWMDHTVIVAFSEFSRTPLINTRGGRDHHLTNSCLVIGAGIKGDTVAGASSDVGMTPQAIDLQTGLPDPGGEVIKPEHVIRSLLADVGYTEDIADLRVDPLHAILKSG